MKKFKFRLETVLKIRKRAEDEKLKQLSLVVSKINEFNRDIRKNEEDIERENNEFMEYLGKESSLHNYVVHQAFLKRLHFENTEFKTKIENEATNLNNARKEFSEASKHRKVIEILKEQKVKEFNALLQKQEREETEEFNLNRMSAQRRAKKNDDRKTGIEHFERFDDDNEIIIKKPKSEFEKLQEHYDKFKK